MSTGIETSRDTDGRVYVAGITYAYDVAGRRFTGSRQGFYGRTAYDRPAEAQAHLTRFPIGAAVEVFYDPADPGNSTLSTAAPGGWKAVSGSVITTVVGSVVTAFGLLPVVFFWAWTFR